MENIEDMVFWTSMSVSWLGAFVIAATLFKHFWKDKITHLKLFGFMVAFSVSFVGLLMICAAIAVRYVDFGR